MSPSAHQLAYANGVNSVATANGVTTNGYAHDHAHGHNSTAHSHPSDRVNGALEKTVGKGFDSIESTVEAFARGEFVIVLDNPSRENEGDLIIASAAMTTEKMAFMIRYTSGYICAPVTNAMADALDLPMMVDIERSADPNRTAYCVTIDAVLPETTTGISAHDRSLTVRTMADPKATSASFRRPGHILPLRARDGGVRARRGHTEAALDLCRLAGYSEAATICEMIVDGEEIPGKAEFTGARMMRRDDCLAFGKKWGLKVCTIEDMVAYLEEKEGKLDVPGVDY